MLISREQFMALTARINERETLAEVSPAVLTGSDELLPPLKEVAALSRQIAFNVAKKAQEEGLALKLDDEMIKAKIDKHFWVPEYRQYKRVSL